jgi:hypothetical protein
MKTNILSLTMSLILILAGQSLFAQETIRPKTAAEFLNSYPAINYRLKNAKVAYVDYAALKEDFLFLKNLTNPQIDHWVIQNFAYMDASQLELLGVRFVGRNQPHPQHVIENGGSLESYNANDFVDMKDIKKSVRPHDYKRADVMEAKDLSGKVVGLIDRKGTGINPLARSFYAPRPVTENYKEYFEAVKAKNYAVMNETFNGDHSDGLSSGGEAIAEVTREKATSLAFNKEGSGVTVKSYFIIDAGIDIIRSNGTKIPAAIYARQAHWRNSGNFFAGTDSLLRIKKSGQFPSSDIVTDDSGFLQRTISDTLVDFGGVVVREESVAKNFDVRKEDYMPGRDGRGDRPNPQKSNPWVWGHQTYDYFIKSGDSEAIARHVTEMMGSLFTAPPEQEKDQIEFRKKLEDRKLALEMLQRNSPELMKHLLAMSESNRDPHFIKYLVPRLEKTQIEEFMKNSSPKAKSEYDFVRSGLHPNYQSGQDLPPLSSDQYIKIALIQAKEADPKIRQSAVDSLSQELRNNMSTEANVYQREDYRKLLAAVLRAAKADPQHVSQTLQIVEEFIYKYGAYRLNSESGQDFIKMMSTIKNKAGAKLRCEAIF